jgi:hypothetical protein
MFRFLLFAAVFMTLVGSTVSVGADNTINGQLASPGARTERLILTPGNLPFGKVAIGHREVRSVTITNSGYARRTVLQVIPKGRAFALRGLTLPLTLARGERFTFKAVFAPRSVGNTRGSISFVCDISSIVKGSQILEMTGTGTDAGQLTVHPATMHFGTVAVGSFANHPGNLTAYGAQVTISSANMSGSEFTLSGLSFPLTIPAGGSQRYTVTFAPKTSGNQIATLSFLFNDRNSRAVQSLNGSGATMHNERVELRWNASTSQDVIGYNVYRSNRPGGPYRRINTVLDVSTVYTDTSVNDGKTYYYVTTSVDSSNQESGYSNETQAVITHYARIFAPMPDWSSIVGSP